MDDGPTGPDGFLAAFPLRALFDRAGSRVGLPGRRAGLPLFSDEDLCRQSPQEWPVLGELLVGASAWRLVNLQDRRGL
jgi:hypothetical protein